jgi:thioredoxin reductase (NADPH)
MYDVIVIGGGIGGFSAAIYAVRYQLKVLLIAEKKGGTIMESHRVENYPGFKAISGVELMKNVEEQAKALGVEIKPGKVEKAEGHDSLFRISTKKETFEAKTLVLATGTEKRKLDIPGEKEFTGKGVSYCATCDAPFFGDKVVGVVGGNDSAAWAAILAAAHAKKVYIIYRKAEIRAEPVNAAKLKNNPKIEFMFNTNVTKVIGDKMMSGVVLDSGKTLELDGLFVEVGSVPVVSLAKELGVELCEMDYIHTNREQKTNVPGVFAVGDVTDTPMRQAITAAGQGAVAAKGCYEHIKNSR